MSNTTHAPDRLSVIGRAVVAEEFPGGGRMNYYMDAVREDVECPNTGNILNFLEAAQAELDNLRAALAAATARADAAETQSRDIAAAAALQAQDASEALTAMRQRAEAAESTVQAINNVMRLGYSIWIQRMRRVPFGVVLRGGLYYTARHVSAYGAGATIRGAIERALAKLDERSREAAQQEVQP